MRESNRRIEHIAILARLGDKRAELLAARVQFTLRVRVSIIYETGKREKWSARELEFKKNHHEFRNTHAKENPLARQFQRLKALRNKSINVVSSAFNNLVSTQRHYVFKHSTEETRDILIRHRVKYVLLSSSNFLIKEPLLCEELIILNAHIAHLPDFRGLDALFWNLRSELPISISVHQVDDGIDTGPIYHIQELKPKKTVENIMDLRAYALLEKHKVMEAALALIINEDHKAIPQPVNSGMLCRPMTVAELIETNEKYVSSLAVSK